MGVAAATITAPLDTSSPNFDPGTDAPDTGKFWDIQIDPGEGMERGGIPTDKVRLYDGQCVPFLLTPWFYALTVLAFVTFFLLVRRRMSAEFGVVGILIAAPWFLIGHSWFTNCSGPNVEHAPFGMKYYAPGENDTVSRVIEAAGRNSPIPGELIGGLLLLAILVLPVVAVFGIRRRGEADEAPDQASQAAPDEPLSGVARVAGEAADRIEGSAGDVDNEVFRAWKRMTDHVDVPDPKTSTPAEFARAARDAGMDEEDVTLLTDLFRAVRYGGEAPTADREERAIEALRKIEAAYGEGGEEE